MFAVIDFETTGLNPATDRILQMAAVVVDITGHVVDSFDTIVKPEQPSEYTHVFEVRDGKITLWRDYFDQSTFRDQLTPGA